MAVKSTSAARYLQNSVADQIVKIYSGFGIKATKVHGSIVAKNVAGRDLLKTRSGTFVMKSTSPKAPKK